METNAKDVNEVAFECAEPNSWVIPLIVENGQFDTEVPIGRSEYPGLYLSPLTRSNYTSSIRFSFTTFGPAVDGYQIQESLQLVVDPLRCFSGFDFKALKKSKLSHRPLESAVSCFVIPVNALPPIEVWSGFLMQEEVFVNG
ncbi:MAG: hypothetical protein QXM60_05600 [Thermoplasmatales archaeon]